MSSPRMRHDAKMTVYLTPGELLAVDSALLELRRRYGVKIDRSRFVREALAGSQIPTVLRRILEAENPYAINARKKRERSN